MLKAELAAACRAGGLRVQGIERRAELLEAYEYLQERFGGIPWREWQDVRNLRQALGSDYRA